MKKKMLLIMMLLITLSGSYKEEAKAVDNPDVLTESLYTSESGPPVFIIFPKDITVKEDSVTTITTQINGTSPIYVDIFHNDVYINDNPEFTITTNQNILSIVIKITKAKHAGKYKIVATNIVGSNSATCEVNVIKN
ncbi:hypothetical protein [Gabonibacter massiliensis]|uniref:hypothetical protein n=1 Tax=Gabonibacter massiliensis TaxID=1720195 RepID=UPI0009ECAF29|nr:hypothetical protein [Gabonibacter massiliensis]